MSYIGRGTESISNVEVLDNLTFDGSASYTLQKSSTNFVPSSANNLLISISGVVQQGNFSVSGSTITFDTTVSASDTCDWILHYGTGLITTVADGAITEAKLGSNAVTTAKINNGAITSAKLDSGLALGKIGQVVSTPLTTTVVTSSSTLTSSGFSVSITPSATSSKIFLSLSCNVFINSDPYGYVGFFRGTTNLGGSNHGMFTISQADKYMPMTFQHLDSPNSTSSLTYNVYYKKSGSLNIYLNPTAGELGSGVPDGATGVFTAMEVLA